MTTCRLGGVWNCTVTVAEPDCFVSCSLVAVIEIVPAAAGAVKSPLALMLPPLADHVTAELELPVPTVAVHCDVAFGATVAGVQATDTEELLDDTDGGGLLVTVLPHAVITSRIAAVGNANRKGFFLHRRIRSRCIRLIETGYPEHNHSNGCREARGC